MNNLYNNKSIFKYIWKIKDIDEHHVIRIAQKYNISMPKLVDGENYVSWENITELKEKVRYYLSNLDESNILNKDISNGSQVWMSHGDTIQDLPHNFKNIASTEDVKVAGYQIKNELTFGIQFHPEVYHTKDGKKLLYNFLIRVCKCSQDWSPGVFVETTINNLRKKLGKDKVVLGLSKSSLGEPV